MTPSWPSRPSATRLHQALKLGDKPLERNAAPHAKKLDLVVASVLRHAAERTRLPLVDRDELLHAAHELGGIVLRKRRETAELGEREKVDASRGMVVVELRRDALLRARKRDFHLGLRPGKRLHAPLLAEFAVVRERRFVPVAHHDVVHGEPERTEKPAVGGVELGRRHVALRDLYRLVHDVRAENAMHQHVAAARGGEPRYLPEAAVEKRKGRDGVVARRHREHTPDLAVPQVALLRDEDARPLAEVRRYALLEDESVVANIPRTEHAFAAHGHCSNAARASHARLADPAEELADRVHPLLWPCPHEQPSWPWLRRISAMRSSASAPTASRPASSAAERRFWSAGSTHLQNCGCPTDASRP